MNYTMRFLLYSDGSEVGEQALNLGLRLALPLASKVDILALSEFDQVEEVSPQVLAAAEKLEAAEISVAIHRRSGFVARELLEQAADVHYDLIVVGSKGRRGFRRLIAGSRACTVLRGTTTSVLIVKGREREDFDDILLCSAAGPASEDTVRYAARVARALDASVTLLHVMSQVALEEHAKAADLEAEAAELMERDAHEGKHLEGMLEILREEGIEAKALVKHGLIVEEIIAEAKHGHFDMLVVGAHTVPGIEELLSSDLSKRIMLAAERPILIVHQAHHP